MSSKPGSFRNSFKATSGTAKSSTLKMAQCQVFLKRKRRLPYFEEAPSCPASTLLARDVDVRAATARDQQGADRNGDRSPIDCHRRSGNDVSLGPTKRPGAAAVATMALDLAAAMLLPRAVAVAGQVRPAPRNQRPLAVAAIVAAVLGSSGNRSERERSGDESHCDEKNLAHWVLHLRCRKPPRGFNGLGKILHYKRLNVNGMKKP